MNMLLGSITFIIIIVLIFGTSKKIKENFTYIDAVQLEHKPNNLLSFSVIMPDSPEKRETETLVAQKICDKSKMIFNMIKYGVGIEWSSWSTWSSKRRPCEKHIDIDIQLHHYLQHKLKPANIVYFEIQRYKTNKTNLDEILLDCDFVSYKSSDTHASHFKMLCAIDIMTKSIYILYIKLIGQISEDRLYMYDDIPKTYVQVSFHDSDYNMSDADTFYSIKMQDETMLIMLYNKLMDYGYDDDNDYIKNMEYDKLQMQVKKSMRQDFFSSGDNNSCNTYRNFPIREDFYVTQ